MTHVILSFYLSGPAASPHTNSSTPTMLLPALSALRTLSQWKFWTFAERPDVQRGPLIT